MRRTGRRRRLHLGNRSESEQYAHARTILERFDSMVVDAIREAADSPLGGIPCSTLWMVLTSSTKLCSSWSAEDFEQYVAGLVRSGKVIHEKTHLLRAIPN